MNFERGTIRSSPYTGIFSIVTDEFALVPHSIHEKEKKLFEKTLEVNAFNVSIAGTSLLGVLGKGLGNRVAVSGLAEKSELQALEKEGIEVITIDDSTSTGNLLALNKNAGIASPLLKKESIEALEGFFKVKFTQMRVGMTDLAGASLTVTNKGFIAHPNTKESDFAELEKLLKVKGAATTANYGDLFVGNSVVANSKGAIAGSLTSGIELSKIDEGLRGD